MGRDELRYGRALLRDCFAPARRVAGRWWPTKLGHASIFMAIGFLLCLTYTIVASHMSPEAGGGATFGMAVLLFNPTARATCVLIGWNPVGLYGAIGDGTTDDATALQNCSTAISAAGGGEMVLRELTYKVNTAISVANFVHVRGVGQSSILRAGTSNYAVNFNPANRAAISHLQVDSSNHAVGSGTTSNGSPTVTGVTTSQGAFVNGQAFYGKGVVAGTTILSGGGTSTLTLSANAGTAAGAGTISAGQAAGGGLDYTNAGSNIMVDHVYFGPGLNRSINLAPAAVRTVYMFNRLRWNGIWGTNTAVYVGDATNLVTDIHFTDVVGTANTTTDVVTWFDIARNVDTFTMAQALCIKGQTGLLLGSRGSTGLTTGAKFSQTVMDTMDGCGVDLGTIRDMDFSTCSIQTCGSATLPGLRVGATVTGMRWTGGVIQGNRGDGVLIKAGQLYTKILGAQVSDNNTSNTAGLNGITVEANASQWDIINCDIGNNVVLATGHQKYGISIAAGTSNVFTIALNDISRNETGPLNDLSTGQIKTVWGNKGLDAAGTAHANIDSSTTNTVYVRSGTGVERVRVANSGLIIVVGEFAANTPLDIRGHASQTAQLAKFGKSTTVQSQIASNGAFVSDLATGGIVLKDTQASPHYWRVTISNVGALVTTDLGTTRPD